MESGADLPIWQPGEQMINNANMTMYMKWLREKRSLDFKDYPSLWRWSVNQLEDFWDSIWDYFDIGEKPADTKVLHTRAMPGAKWFQGAKLNYAEQVFRNETQDYPAVVFTKEDSEPIEITWKELREKTAAVAQYLKDQGVKAGDRVIAYMPNTPETLIAFLACASIGAIWSCCAPEFGETSTVDRFKQIEPTVFFAVTDYRFNGKIYDRSEAVEKIRKDLPTLKKTVIVPNVEEINAADLQEGVDHWDKALLTKGQLTFEQVPFEHPLWILYSSGTTGIPKAIVQGHGGIVLEHLKKLVLQSNTKPGDRFFWYTSTSWMMWNLNIGALLAKATVVLYDGSPTYPKADALWMLADKTKAAVLGLSAGYIHHCMKEGIQPEKYNLSQLKGVGCTASPLKPEAFVWLYDHLHKDTWLLNTSGGTDVCTGFVGGSPLEPLYIGELQRPSLGAKVESWDEEGNPLINEVGELVVTEPMPSMPLFFWNDPNNERYRESYFDMYPGIWRHGDWLKINERGGCTLYGRSDSTINRNGIRIGTSEIYDVVESLEEIRESLVIDLEYLNRPSYMAMFVALKDGQKLDDTLKEKIKTALRKGASPKHLPNEIYQIDEVPKTMNGKKMEVPIRRILLGHDVDKAVNKDSMANPQSLDFYIELGKKLNAELTK